MNHYFYQRFPSQLSQLEFTPDSHDPTIVRFGRLGWENFNNDLNTVPPEDRSRFILSLFMIILTDQALYRYFRVPHSTICPYSIWRRSTNFPNFGGSGFDVHNENPFKILSAPERQDREGIININEVLALIPEFVKFLVYETTDYFRKHLPEVDIHLYFDKIRGDDAYAFDEGEVVPRFKAEFEALTNRG
jgi:hypothetical protein